MLATQSPPPVAPAGGAEFTEILIASAMALAVNLPVIWFIWRTLGGKPTVIGRVADWIAAKDGLPRWASLPSYGLIVCLLTAGFGVWWDVPIHMQVGRDEGPLANPSHYPIYFAILGFFALGVISATLAYGQPLPRRTLKIAGNWRMPMGSAILIAAGTVAVAGFPLDDVWHRLFGQDVTEWGPTHVMMIGGAVTSALALPLFNAEARQLGAPGTVGFGGKLRATITIGLCIIPFAFLMEFDLGVPQFPAATQFIIAGLLTGWVFVTARRFFGPGGALIAWAVYAIAHAFLFLTIAALPDVLEARFLLFLPAAVLVELVALVIKPKRGWVFGRVAGLLAGSLGMLAEWGWTHVFMPLPQPLPASVLPLMLLVGTVAGIGGGLLGVWHYEQLERIGGDVDDTVDYGWVENLLRKLKLSVFVPVGERIFGVWRREMLERTSPGSAPPVGALRSHGLGLAGMGVFLVLMAVFAPPGDEEGITGTVNLAEDCAGEPGCMSEVTVDLRPSDVADDAIWLYTLSYQGRHHTEGKVPGDGVLGARMVPTGQPGQFRSESPVPLHGNWKVLLRMHTAPTTLVTLPLHAPDDPAITSPKGRLIAVQSGDTLPFTYEPDFLQRERKDDVSAWLWTAAYVVVGLIWLATIAFYGWAYAHASSGTTRTAPARDARPREQGPAPTGRAGSAPPPRSAARRR